jgi:competence protein ComGC
MQEITQNFLDSATSISQSQITVWQRQTDALSERQNEASKRLDKMVADGLITQADAEERKAKSEEILNKKRFETEMKIYKLNKATAIADVVFNSARAVSRMMAFPPPFGPLMAAAAGAAAMAQIATIASAPAPTMHAGGMVPDETQITALKGEAVLNRAAVRNAGGPEGIHKMNRGESSGEKIVVIQPFKHFDRFVRASQRRGILAQPTAKTGSGGY